MPTTRIPENMHGHLSQFAADLILSDPDEIPEVYQKKGFDLSVAVEENDLDAADRVLHAVAYRSPIRQQEGTHPKLSDVVERANTLLEQLRDNYRATLDN